MVLTTAVALPILITSLGPKGESRKPQLPFNRQTDSVFSKNISEEFRIVWVLDENSNLQPRRVITGIENGTSVEIISGLKEGDEVVVSMSAPRGKASKESGLNLVPRMPASGSNNGG